MAFQLKAHIAIGSPSGNDVTTNSIDTTGSNRIVVGLVWFASAGTGATVTDNKSNTYVADGSITTNGANYTRIFECTNPTVGTGHTFTGANLGAGSFPAITVTAWSGNDTTSNADQTNNAGGGSSQTSIQPGSITPGAANELVVAVAGGEVTGTISVDSSMSISDQVAFVSAQNFSICMAYIVQTTALAINPTFSWSSGATFGNANIASFKSGAVVSIDNLMGQASL